MQDRNRYCKPRLTIRKLSFERLRRRNLVQWALAQAALAFALFQGVDVVPKQWPERARRAITLALVLACGMEVLGKDMERLPVGIKVWIRG